MTTNDPIEQARTIRQEIEADRPRVDAIVADARAYTDRLLDDIHRPRFVPAPRPAPTTRQRMTDARSCGHTTEQHRHGDGQDNDAASHDRAMRAVTAERDEAYAEITAAWAAINTAGRTGPHSIAEHITHLASDLDVARRHRDEATEVLDLATADRDRLRDDLASTQQVATFRQGVIDQYRDEIGACGEVIAVVRDAQEQIERALARFDTTPEVSPVETEAEEAEDVRSPLAAERDRLVDTIGRLTSLPPERVAEMHNVGYTGGGHEAEAPGSPSPRAQDDLSDRLAAVVVWLMRLNGGEGVTTSTWQTWEALLAEHAARVCHREETEQALRDRVEHAIRERLAKARPDLDGLFLLDQVAAVAAVAAVATGASAAPDLGVAA